MERNAREKERSCKIARQIDELRALLSRGGVTVTKGTKITVLAEAANYINLLQQQQVQWEMDRQSLVQQMQQMQANAQSAIQGQTGRAITGRTNPLNPTPNPLLPSSSASAISPDDYKHIFESSTVGMAIATLGGAFVDCNSIFSQLSEYTKEEVAVMTIFNMTSRADLQHAFDLISQMITPSDDADKDSSDDGGQSIVLRGAMKSRSDLGLSISLIRGEGGMAKCFCVTLVRILSIESTRPDTVSIELELPQVCTTKRQRTIGFGAGPAYTSG
ncbi:hypothetical protein THAOC_14684 [Thalassiosira oceanica]|uniref:BHLH domain-containing protein n=1 Tax=Thalassiosira oceanica TaxID=159749 RepID=K0SGS0_THAOC|nr:hypothetical protein THAOC_14684 [Thalassiosira oceanica]|eukprot:EJK64575.1 hypothetical protein THAOC_14684 [Thalassiosira oceanica]